MKKRKLVIENPRLTFWDYLFFVFLHLKLSNHIADWPWIFVFMPMILEVCIRSVVGIVNTKRGH